MEDEAKVGTAWRKGVAGPVWLVGDEVRSRVTLARWIAEEGEMRQEEIEVLRDSLLAGDGGWRAALPSEAEEALELMHAAMIEGDETAERAHAAVAVEPVSPTGAVQSLAASAQRLADARVCEPHQRENCSECTPWLASSEAVQDADRAALVARIAAAEEIRATFDPQSTNSELGRWVERIRNGETGHDDDPMYSPFEMGERLKREREERERRWRRVASPFEVQRAIELADRTGYGRIAALRAVMTSDTVQTAQAVLASLVAAAPTELVDGYPGLAEEVLSSFPALAPSAEGIAFMVREMKARVADGQWRPSLPADDRAQISRSLSEEHARIRSELRELEPAVLLNEVRGLRRALKIEVPRIVAEVDGVLERAEVALAERIAD